MTGRGKQNAAAEKQRAADEANRRAVARSMEKAERISTAREYFAQQRAAAQAQGWVKKPLTAEQNRQALREKAINNYRDW